MPRRFSSPHQQSPVCGTVANVCQYLPVLLPLRTRRAARRIVHCSHSLHAVSESVHHSIEAAEGSSSAGSAVARSAPVMQQRTQRAAQHSCGRVDRLDRAAEGALGREQRVFRVGCRADGDDGRHGARHTYTLRLGATQYDAMRRGGTQHQRRRLRRESVQPQPLRSKRSASIECNRCRSKFPHGARWTCATASCRAQSRSATSTPF